MRTRKASVVGMVTLAVLLIAGVGSVVPSVAQPPRGGVYKIGLPDEIDNFNPFIRLFAATASVVGSMYESMMWIDYRGNYRPCLASSYSTSSDGLTWTFKLVTNATWHDGTKFTAKDVKFTFDTVIDPKYAAKIDRFKLSDYIEKIAAVDDSTVAFTLKKKWAPFLYYVGGFYSIVPEHIFSKQDILTFKNMDNPVGTGPFKFAKYTPGTAIELTAYDKYWRGRTYTDGVTYVLYKAEAARMLALEAGEIETQAAATLAPEMVGVLLRNPKIKVYNLPGFTLRWVGFNCKKYPLSLREVREAIAYSINKKDIVDTVMGGFADVAPDGWVFTTLGVWVNPKVGSRPQDFKKANEILDKLGFAPGADGVRVTPNGTRLSFSVLTLAGRPEFIRSAELITESLKKVGIETRVETLTLGTVDQREGVGEFDLGFMGAGYGWEVDPLLFPRFHSAGSRPLGVYAPTNWMRYESKEADALLEAQREEVDLKKRIDIVHKLQEVIGRDLPLIPLYTKNILNAYRIDKFTNIIEEEGPTSRVSLIQTHLIPPPKVVTQITTVAVEVIPTWTYGLVIAVLVVAAIAVAYPRMRKK